ncbi:MAG: AbrB/MazE/SpoVT family DNA-binding domain-containing protein [Methanocellales archaeon]|nr:AbrB/MazE/SpoVT family DNA-binding domain-containing protein [Methanocellales archaeon]
MSFIGKVTDHGRVRIPRNLRELHDIEDGDFIEMEILKVHKKEERK